MDKQSPLKIDALINILKGPAKSSSTKIESDSKVYATLVADTHCLLGECVLYNKETNQILWTNIDGKEFYKLNLSTEKPNLDVYQLPKMLGAFALVSFSDKSKNNDGTYLCGWEDGFELFNIETQTTTPSSKLNYSKGVNVAPLGLPTRLNDGRCDNEGRRFICGGYYGDLEDVTMKVFKCEQQQQSKTLAHQELHHLENGSRYPKDKNSLQVTNSICFSPSGDIMYLADSPSRAIYKYKYDKELGQITDKSLLTQYDDTNDISTDNFYGVPDGSCVDSEGYIWNAVWRCGKGSSYVNRIHPDTGEIVYVVHMPDTTSQVTCCCFGGEDLDILFISTACITLENNQEVNAGGLYAVKVPFKGRPEARFQVN